MAKTGEYRGVVVPMVSPFTAEGAIDGAAVGRIVDHLVGGGVEGVFVLGTTGESASIHAEEKRKLVEATVRAVGLVGKNNAGPGSASRPSPLPSPGVPGEGVRERRVLVYAGISGNSLLESVEAAGVYRELGADVVVAHPPFYYALNDAEMEAYFLRLADSVPLPLVVYNIPSTTHVSIGLDCVERLSRHENVVAIKDSSGDRQRVSDLMERFRGREGFSVLLGASPLYAHGLRLGAAGLVPSGANLAPREYHAMYEAAMAGQWEEVDRLQEETNAVTAQYVKGRRLGESLTVLKALMEKRGLCGRAMLPPLREYEG